MLTHTQKYRDNVYADVRQFDSRITMHMDAFSNLAPQTSNLTLNYVGKVAASLTENRNIAKFSKATTINTPTAYWIELNQGYYDAIKVQDVNPFDVYTTGNGIIGQMLFSYDVIDMLTKQFGEYIWKGKTSIADKVAIAKVLISQVKCNWRGYGYGVKTVAATPYRVRYIRDTVNGSTANAFAYWNSIKAMAGTTDRAQGKVATSNGTITNVANLTDGNDTTYGYIGVAGTWYAQVDLGAVYTDIDTIKILHYYLDGRTFHGVKTQISEDGITWTTLYDSTVSGEYAETSAGKSYSPSSQVKDFSATLNVYSVPTNSWGAATTTTAQTHTTISKYTNNVENVIDANGYVHFNVFTNPAGTTLVSELFTDFVEFTAIVDLVTTRQYFDDTVMRFNLLEDMSTLNDTLPANQLSLTLNNETGEFDLMNVESMLKILASNPEINVELGIVYEDGSTEWIPMGTFFMSDWKNDVTSKVISVTANDYFYLMADISYSPTATTNLKTLAIEVLNASGVPTNRQIVDNSLAQYTVTRFTDRMDCRSALQYIGIAAMSAVYQDRHGNVVIKPFRTIDQASNYYIYASTQDRLWHYASPSTYPLLEWGGGMKYLDFDAMYEVPEITLEKSIYQLIVKVYNTDPEVEPIDYLFTNDAIEGISGQSFEIDNPLVNTFLWAQDIANWYFREINYNAYFVIPWRQNPVLECADVILVEDSFGSEKQSRIIKQEFNYEGYLEGITTSRGGV
jgi:hypothetical protein